VLVSGCRFAWNHAWAELERADGGGASLLATARGSFDRCAFERNEVTSGYGARGGAVFFEGVEGESREGVFAMERCELNGDHVSLADEVAVALEHVGGGGVFVQSASFVSFGHCTLIRTAVSLSDVNAESNGEGGGLSVRHVDTVMMHNMSIEASSALSVSLAPVSAVRGGAICMNDVGSATLSSLRLLDCGCASIGGVQEGGAVFIGGVVQLDISDSSFNRSFSLPLIHRR
jgi:hypothetical protein